MNKKIIAAVAVIAVAVFVLADSFKDRLMPKEETVWPTGDITMYVPWAAGGVTDIAARGFANSLMEVTGKNVTVLNVPGASGLIGTQQALEEKADGSSLIVSVETAATFQVLGTGDISYGKDLSTIQLLVSDAKVVVVPADSPYNTMEDLVKAIKENPGKITMSYTGPGASGHIQGLLYKKAGLDINDVPMGDGSTALTAIFSGTVDFTNANLATVIDHIKSGKVKALAVFSDTASEGDYGYIPPITDAVSELKEYMPFYFPNCITVDIDVDQEVQEQILKVCQQASQTESWKEFAQKNGYLVLTDITGQEAEEYWENWRAVVAYLFYDNGFAKVNPEELGIERP